MRPKCIYLGASLGVVLAGACNTPEPAAGDGEPGMVDLGTIDETTGESALALLTTASAKKKCPSNSTDPGCVKGRIVFSSFAQLDRSILGVSCQQTSAGETTDVSFEILDPVAKLRQVLVEKGDVGSISTITVHTVDKAGKTHTIEGITQTILLDGRKVATITTDNKQHSKAKVEKSLAGAATVLAVISSPSWVFEQIAHAPEKCQNNTVNPPHPDIFQKDHGCAACRVAKGSLLVSGAFLAVAIFPEIALGVGLAESLGVSVGAAVAAAADAWVVAEVSCEARCKIGECVDKAEECFRLATPGQAKSCDRAFAMCCRGAGGQCQEDPSIGATCVACKSPSAL
jgi:hypothetical protein